MAAPKKAPKKKKDEEGAETLAPKSILEQAREKMIDLEKMASLSRTQALKLGNENYCVELVEELKERAASAEKFYKHFQTGVEKKKEKLLKTLIREAEEKEADGLKAKAWSRSSITSRTNSSHIFWWFNI